MKVLATCVANWLTCVCAIKKSYFPQVRIGILLYLCVHETILCSNIQCNKHAEHGIRSYLRTYVRT